MLFCWKERDGGAHLEIEGAFRQALLRDRARKKLLGDSSVEETTGQGKKRIWNHSQYDEAKKRKTAFCQSHERRNIHASASCSFRDLLQND
jgi:hypothetical protein